ncbi:MAG: DNA-binding transcriptional MerR regulator [Candidatus Endobugula sp.]|jgi:DNA-binding transcriptional MerR regulator
MKISEMADVTGVSTDTLRYYEKISLLTIARTKTGIRRYSDKDIKTIRFIKQAQKIGFSLEDIAQLLHFRDDPENVKPQVRAMIKAKLEFISRRIGELKQLESELSVLVNQCQNSQGDCPILKNFEKQ